MIQPAGQELMGGLDCVSSSVTAQVPVDGTHRGPPCKFVDDHSPRPTQCRAKDRTEQPKQGAAELHVIGLAGSQWSVPRPNQTRSLTTDTSCTSGYLVSEQDKTGLASCLPWKAR